MIRKGEPLVITRSLNADRLQELLALFVELGKITYHFCNRIDSSY
jgi:hypothetical protein